jgi:antitoxin component of MazEF toxin-antitoxin module
MKKNISTKVSAWGNGYGIRVPKDFVQALDLKKSDTLDIQPQGDGVFLLRKSSQAVSKEKFRKSLSSMKQTSVGEESLRPVGKEKF